jgi:hypothetical protein
MDINKESLKTVTGARADGFLKCQARITIELKQ